MVWDGMGSIYLLRLRHLADSHEHVNTFSVSAKSSEFFLTYQELLDAQEGICSMETSSKHALAVRVV